MSKVQQSKRRRGPSKAAVSDDPMEVLMRDALNREGFAFTEDGQQGSEVNAGLDFHLTDYGIHIEVKRMHSDRISGQMARSSNVIACQGPDAVEFLAALLCDYKRVCGEQ